MMEKFGFGHNKSADQHRPSAHSFKPAPTRQLIVETSPGSNFVLDNVLAVPPNTFEDGQYVICDDRYVFSVRVAPGLAPNALGAGGTQREWTQWAFGQQVKVAAFDIFANNSHVYLASLNLEIDFYNRRKINSNVYDQEMLTNLLMRSHRDQIFTPGQLFAMEQGGFNFKVKVVGASVIDLSGSAPIEDRRGILIPQTEVVFHKSSGSPMQLKGSSRARTNLLQPNFSFDSMGIGGLDQEFSTIFRRAFASRICPPRDIEKLGIQHVKGVLLYGPPGTGKTLIARQIGKMLNTVEPKVVNGPEMLSKYVGGSEENIRNLFKDAEAEYREKGEDSNLHIIIFDELDAVFKQRGSRSDGTGVGDNVVNQLLAKMDGVDQLNNILVIGMTNRRDLIDSALLRPGRFEVQLEIPLPDEGGRLQIFTIHTKKMRETKMLGSDVDLAELAAKTKNYSGAEIGGVVKAAASFALKRNFVTSDKGTITFDDKKQLIVVRDDFLQAIEQQKPAFGVSEEQLQDCIHGGIIHYNSDVNRLLEQGDGLISQVRHSDKFPLISVLVSGPPGSGKSALVSSVALNSGFPFIKLISPDSMVGMSESQKINHIQTIFSDAHKSPQNVIVIDQLEQIIEWVDVGPRFSNSVLQALMVMIRKFPPTGRRLIVFATTSRREVFEHLGLLGTFNQEMYTRDLQSIDDLKPIMAESEFLDPPARDRIVETLKHETRAKKLGFGIKKALFYIEAAKVSADPAQSLVDTLVEIIPRETEFVFKS